LILLALVVGHAALALFAMPLVIAKLNFRAFVIRLAEVNLDAVAVPTQVRIPGAIVVVATFGIDADAPRRDPGYFNTDHPGRLALTRAVIKTATSTCALVARLELLAVVVALTALGIAAGIRTGAGIRTRAAAVAVNAGFTGRTIEGAGALIAARSGVCRNLGTVPLNT
jgi:hypothetical protein